MMKTVFKRLPCGGYKNLPVDFLGIELLAELCSRELDGFLEKQQVIPNPHHPRDVLREAAKVIPWTWNRPARDNGVMLRKKSETSSSKNPPSPDSVLFLETSDEAIMLPPPVKKQKTEHKNGKTKSSSQSLPAAFKRKILELAGPDAVVSEEKLLIQKRLTKTDLDKGQSRLSIPSKQMREAKFLTDAEKRILAYHDGKNVGSIDNVTIIEPSLKTSQAKRSWDIGSSVCYIITKGWIEITKRNAFKVGMNLQVWAIRVRGNCGWLSSFCLIRKIRGM